MTRKFSKQQHQWLWFFLKKGRPAGFTLLELLVALFIGGIITSLLLFTVVQLLQTNQREAARSDTQRDVQMALDYIARDLREAVYVYDSTCFNSSTTCSGLLNYLPTAISGRDASAQNLPVLAFWRVDPLPDPLIRRCETNAAAIANTQNQADFPAAIRGVPCISRQMYTLVVYSLNWKNDSNNWRGKARIERYQLPQFPYTVTGSPPTVSTGWVYPASQATTNFLRWPLSNKAGADGNPINLQTEAGGLPVVSSVNPLVLVDFVDQTGVVDAGGSDSLCPNPSTDYVITPDQALANRNRGFYVCVKGASNDRKLNQEVVVRIQGNAAGRPGLTRSGASVAIPMETRVLTRGVYNKV